jgi:hypothetical protein
VRSFPAFLELVDPVFCEEEGVRRVLFLPEEDLVDWPAAGRGCLGLAAEVWTASGRPALVLVQVEIRPARRSVIERRLLRGYLCLLAGHRRPGRPGRLIRLVAVLLQGEKPGVRAAAIVETCRGTERMRIPYTLLSLAGRPLEDYLPK